MKNRLPVMSVLLALACVGAEPSAHVQLAGVRCQYPSAHDMSRHRLVLRLDVLPDTPGWFVYEAAARSVRLRGYDRAGNMYTSDPGDWQLHEQLPGARTVHFTFALPNKVDSIDVRETLDLQLAEKLMILPLSAVSMLEVTHHAPMGVPIRCKPEAGNEADENREADGTLRRAGLSIICPDDVNILRVSRVWRGEEGMAPYRQDLEVKRYTTPSGEKYAYVVLWDAAAAEELEITTCTRRCAAQAPLRLRAMLGDPAAPLAPSSVGDTPVKS